MNKKITGLAIALLVITMASSPVMAIGPQNAEKSNNPNLAFTDSSVHIFLPSGAINEWITEEQSHVQIKSATLFYIGNCYTPATASEILYNKWNFLSPPVFYQFLLSVGFPQGQAYAVAFVLNPDGVFYKEVYTGNG
jgi:hypothetical protein